LGDAWGMSNDQKNRRTRSQSRGPNSPIEPAQQPLTPWLHTGPTPDPINRSASVGRSAGKLLAAKALSINANNSLDRPDNKGGDRPGGSEDAPPKVDQSLKDVDLVEPNEDVPDKNVEVQNEADDKEDDEPEEEPPGEPSIPSDEPEGVKPVSEVDLSTPEIPTSEASNNEVEGILEDVDNIVDNELPIDTPGQSSQWKSVTKRSDRRSENPEKRNDINEPHYFPQSFNTEEDNNENDDEDVGSHYYFSETEREAAKQAKEDEQSKSYATGLRKIPLPIEKYGAEYILVDENQWNVYKTIGRERILKAFDIMMERFKYTCHEIVLGRLDGDDIISSYLRDQIKAGRLVTSKEPNTTQNVEPVVLLAAITTNDKDVDPDPSKKHKLRNKEGDHDDALGKLAAINAATRKEPAETRPMSQVLLKYGKNRIIPDGLAGSISVSLAMQHQKEMEAKEARRREKVERAKKSDPLKVPLPTSPTNISKPAGQNPLSPFDRLRLPRSQEYTTKLFQGLENNINNAAGKNADDGQWPPDETTRSNRNHQSPSASSHASKGNKSRKKKKKPSSYGSSNSSDYSTSSFGSSDPSTPSSVASTGGNKKRRKRHHKKYRDESVKMKLPAPYNGKADLDAFDQWTFRVTNYAKVMKISDKTMIRVIADLVTDKAQGFYMDYVATRQERWTLASLFPAMFDYCFPNDIMQRLRKKWDNMVQGKGRVQDYARDMEKLARKFKEVNERTVVIAFWKGLNMDLRKHMILMGVDPEIDDLNTVLDKALISEKARDQTDRMSKETERQGGGESSKTKREWTRFKNRTGGTKNYKPGNKDDKPQNTKSDKVRANAISPQNTPDYKSRSGSNQKRLPRAKLDELRAEGKCFNCRQPGHEQRNCPKLQSMRPPRPGVGAGAVSFAKMEKLAAKKEKADVYVGNVRIMTADPIAELQKEYEDLELRVHQICEKAWGEDSLWYNEETRHECKYSIGVDDEEITVWNFVKGGSRSFTRENLDDPDFDIAKIFTNPEPIRLPTSVREGGYPVIENYNRWDWPAINWMHARLSGQLHFVDEGNAPEGVKNEHRIDVQPTMFGYSIQLDESDLIYNVTHKEVLDDHFSPEWIIDHMLTARNVQPELRGDRFEDKRLSNYITVMLGMTHIPGQQAKIKKRGNKKRIIDPEGVAAIERTTLRVKDKTRRLPEPIVIEVKINGQPIRALVDTGSMADFLSTTLVDQLQLSKVTYEKPLPVQLAVHGSRSKINCGTTVKFQYQTINCDRRFDIVNLDNYDAILGTPFMFQHQVAIGFNPSRVIVGSNEPLEIKGPEVTTITSASADLLNEGLDKLRKELRQEAEDLCPDTSMTAMPPM